MKQKPITTYSSLLQKQKKYIPTPQSAQIIMSYFIFNNFQDFNTWQQIARTKSQYQYIETNKGIYHCKMNLKWQDKTLIPISKIAQGKNKKDAKKKATIKMIEDILYQGYIGYGFKDDDFIKKIPRRRKEETDQSQKQEDIQEINYNNSKYKQLLIQGKFNQALLLINLDNFSQIWHYALDSENLLLCQKIILFLQGQSQKSFEWQVSCKKQFEESIMEDPPYQFIEMEDPLTEDLTDFLQFYQFQWPQKEPVQTLELAQPKQLPSECLLKNTKFFTHQDFFKYFHPIEKIYELKSISLKQLQKQQVNNYLSLPYEITLPRFQQDSKQLSYKSIENLYDSLLYYSHNYKFIMKVLIMMKQLIKTVKIRNNEYNIECGKYYLLNKNLATAEFLYLLFIKSLTLSLSIEGMITQTTGKSAYTILTFQPKQSEDVLAKKISKKMNTNEFEESYQIGCNQYVLLASKITQNQRYIAYVVQTYPTIKIIAPSLPFELNTPKPYTLYKLFNGKIYEKISQSIIQVSKKFLNVISDNVYIYWQPQTYPKISLISELLCQWVNQQGSILLVSSAVDVLHAQLTNLGFKCLKISPKFDQKQIMKFQLVCSSPNAVCCDAIKNYAFTKVLLDDAHQISQVISLMAIAKGCKKLFLIGDINLPRPKVLSSYCKKFGMNISLIQRLIKTNKNYCTYISQLQIPNIHHTILEFPNQFIYKNKLLISYTQSPLIKGFQWASQWSRVSLIHISLTEKNQIINQQIKVCLQIIDNVLKTGFIQLNQIICLVTHPIIKSILITKIYKYFYSDKEEKISLSMLDKIVQIVDGCKSIEKDLAIVLMNQQYWEQNYLNACFFYSKRGLIFIGNLHSFNDRLCQHFFSWASQKKIILTINH